MAPSPWITRGDDREANRAELRRHGANSRWVAQKAQRRGPLRGKDSNDQPMQCDDKIDCRRAAIVIDATPDRRAAVKIQRQADLGENRRIAKQASMIRCYGESGGNYFVQCDRLAAMPLQCTAGRPLRTAVARRNVASYSTIVQTALAVVGAVALTAGNGTVRSVAAVPVVLSRTASAMAGGLKVPQAAAADKGAAVEHHQWYRHPHQAGPTMVPREAH